MNKILFLLLIVSSFFVTSCYSSKVIVGEVNKSMHLKKIKSSKNHFFLGGLIPAKSTQSAVALIGSEKNYLVKTRFTFLDGLIGGITFGIYTPTTTSYYIPASSNQ